MKKILLIGLFFTCLGALSAQKVEHISDGVKIYLDAQDVTQEVQFYSDGIVRVVKYPGTLKPEKKSYSVIMSPRQVELIRVDDGKNIVLSTNNVVVRIDKTTGKIAFCSRTNEPLLVEKEYGVSFVPVKDGRKDSYKISQDFKLDKDEIIYGLGQQQTGMLNQRGQSLMLRNENTKVCIPQTLRGMSN